MNASKLRIYFRMQHTAGVIKKVADKLLLESANLTTAQAGVLTIVSSTDDITQKELALVLDLNEAAITTMVSRLTKLNYLERKRHPTDGRAWCLYVTSEGKQALKNMSEPFQKINKAIEEALDINNLEEFAENLDKLSQKFNDFPSEK